MREGSCPPACSFAGGSLVCVLCPAFGLVQRLGIARALYHNPEILVFDEATSALDTDTETAIMEAIESFHGKKTLVIIAHRLRTIAGCDIIYKVDNGKIVETTLAAEEH